MANDVFHIPEEFQELNEPQNEVVVDDHYTPEKDPVPYGMFGRAAHEIDTIRETILSGEKAKWD